MREGGSYKVREDGSKELVERTNWKPEKPATEKDSKKTTKGTNGVNDDVVS